MVRIKTSKGDIVNKIFKSTQEAKRWFKKNSWRYPGSTIRQIVTEKQYNKYYKGW